MTDKERNALIRECVTQLAVLVLVADRWGWKGAAAYLGSGLLVGVFWSIAAWALDRGSKR